MIRLKEIEYAAERSRSVVIETPVISSPVLDKMVGATAFLKCESLQVTGSFKIRGAINAFLQEQREAPVEHLIAYSTGNHGQAISYLGSLFGVTSSIIVPPDIPKVKARAIERFGGQLVYYDPYKESDRY